MKILKRILVLLCVLALMTAALCGCGGDKQTEDEAGNSS